MNPRCSLSRCCPNFAAILITLLAGWAAPAAAQPAAAPYVFFLLDTSGSMNYSPPCTQDQIDAGACGFLCPTGDCFVPMQGDDPASKLYQIKQGLYTSIAPHDDLLFGFASFNQDALNVRAKHWLYQATGNGPSVGTWGPFPAAGAQEVFGLNWTCGSGTGDSGVGCTPSNPADLNDPWELTRVQRLPKGGLAFNTAIIVYIRYAGIIYKVSYTPTGTGPGASSIQTNVTIYRCTNLACSASTLIGTSTVSWARVGDFVSWDIDVLRTNPELGYFSQTAAADATTSNTCAGWEPNTDTTSDRNSSAYDLRWLTDPSDPRGTYFTKGDVIPLDWNNDHKLDIAAHLAPNLALDPMATPSFRIAAYLNDNRSGADTFLRLKTENSRPLIASGATPLGNALTSFRTWYSGCSGTCGPGGWSAVASAQDPDWVNRRVALVLLTDGDETCASDPCTQARNLYTLFGIRTFVVAFGAQPVAGSQIECTAYSGGTGAPYYPQTKQELIDDLALLYAAAANP